MRATIILLTVCLAGSAFADEETLRPEEVAARAHFQAGKVYFEQGDLKRALVEFREAQRDFDKPALDYNLARTYDRLDDAAHAVTAYRRYLEREPQTEDRKAIEERIAALEPQVGHLTLVSHMPDARLLVDEEPTQANQPIAITAGKHRVVASKEGYLSRTTEVDVVGGKDATLEIDPITLPAAQPVAPAVNPVTLPTTPAGAQTDTAHPRRWWIALVVAGAAVLAAGAIVIAVLATRDNHGDPVRGNVDTGLASITP